MTYRNFQIGEAERQEILQFDILFRLNAKRSLSVLLDREQEFLEESFQHLLSQGYLIINDVDEYELSDRGKETLEAYGRMFQRFKDMAIFKCVYPERGEPEPGYVDERFGAYVEEANPPESEDYRVLIFENFCTRENRRAPLHLFVFFSLIENQDLESEEADWIWQLATGEIFDFLKEVIDSQVSAEAICPDGLHPDELVDEIYRAGMQELKRCYEEDRHKYDYVQQKEDSEHFWVEEVETHDKDPRQMDYYEPYWQPQVGIGSALCVGAFAGLATCALLS